MRHPSSRASGNPPRSLWSEAPQISCAWQGRVPDASQAHMPAFSGLPADRPWFDRARAWILWTASLAVLYGVLFLDAPLSALNFPLNDDWAYARVVRNLIETGRYELTTWCGMPLLPQAIWGVLFSGALGFSFNSLRLSTLVLAVVTIVLLEKWIRSSGVAPLQAILGVCLIGFNPVFFTLANSFMTDVPFTALLVGALTVYPKPGATLQLIAFAATCVAMTLQRQIGLAIAAAYLIHRNLHRGIILRERIEAGIPLVASALAYTGVRFALDHTTGLPSAFNVHIDQLVHTLQGLSALDAKTLQAVSRNIIIIICFLGLFSFPLAMRVWGSLAWTQRAVVIALTWAIVRLYPHLHIGMPMTDNVWIDGGIGPLTLREDFISGNTYHRFPEWLSRDLIWLSAFGGSVVIARFAQVALGREDGRRFLLVAIGIYGMALVLVRFFDRYLIPLLVMTVPLLGERRRGAWYWEAASWAGCLILAVSSLAGTYEYLSWNRARWQALNELTEVRKVEPHEIDGGLEFNGWHFCQRECAGRVAKPGCFFVQDDRWLIARSSLDGYQEMFRIPYPRFGLKGREKSAVLALRRISE